MRSIYRRLAYGIFAFAAGPLVDQFATIAAAADLPAAYPYPAPTIPVLNRWAGVYGGLNLGYGVGETVFSTTALGDPVGLFGEMSGFVLGGQFGLNYQIGRLVFGAEADVQGTNIGRSIKVLGATINNTVPWFLTVRERVGLAVDSDMLFYTTAGFGYGAGQANVSVWNLAITANENRVAAVYGVGVEKGWGASSVKIEYLGMQTFPDRSTISGVTGNAYFRSGIIRIGYNYRFFGN
jgi:outer membrane immunogenic protein